MPAALPIDVGDKFGRLTVQQVIPGGIGWWGTRYRKIRCQCVCGKVTDVLASSLNRGRTRSCGCYSSDLSRKRKTKHGQSKTSVYLQWRSIVQAREPTNLKHSEYLCKKDYMCLEWENSFEVFRSEVGDPPSDKHILSLIDPSGIYCKANCCWINKDTETRIGKGWRPITVNGVTKTLNGWCRHNGWALHTISKRLRLGWSEHDAVTAPLGTKNPNTQKVNP